MLEVPDQGELLRAESGEGLFQAPLFGLAAMFYQCLLTLPSLCVCLCVHISPFYKDISHFGLGLTLMTLFYPDYKYPVQARSHSVVLGVRTSPYEY